MRIAYLDCFSGVSGDMFLGALIDCGVPASVLMEATAALNIGASLRVEPVERSGISCTRVHVMEGKFYADAMEEKGLQEQQSAEPHTHHPQTQHLHKTGHAHQHDAHPQEETQHAHTHGRSLSVIREMILAAPLQDAVKKTAVRAFELLGRSEAKIHNVDLEKVHFHEVGAVDAIVDIVAASAGIHHLQIGTWYCSPLNVGGGIVECAHGTFPVPAPATADLLRGCPTYSAHVQKELVTPTGAALVRALDPVFGQQPAMRTEQIGYGAGARNPEGFPNVLRLQIGTAEFEDKPMETVTVIETALDDLSPQVLAWVAETALAAGALDVMLTPVVMKKGRPGTLLTVLCDAPKRTEMERLILRETSTLGVRVREEQRVCLERTHIAVATIYGSLRVKVGSVKGEVMNAAPEFEDCRAAAVRHGVALKLVQQAAIGAYEQQVRGATKKNEEDIAL